MVTINQMVKDSIKARKSQKELHHFLMLKAWVGKKVKSIWLRTGKMSSLTFISSYSICHSWKDGWLWKSTCVVVVPHQVIWNTLP